MAWPDTADWRLLAARYEPMVTWVQSGSVVLHNGRIVGACAVQPSLTIHLHTFGRSGTLDRDLGGRPSLGLPPADSGHNEGS